MRMYIKIKTVYVYVGIITAGVLVIFERAHAAFLPCPFCLPDVEGLAKGNLIDFIGTIISMFLSLVGAIFLLMMIYGGILYLVSGGDEARIKKAKTTLTYAVVGIIVISGSWILTDFIVSNVIMSR